MIGVAADHTFHFCPTQQPTIRPLHQLLHHRGGQTSRPAPDQVGPDDGGDAAIVIPQGHPSGGASEHLCPHSSRQRLRDAGAGRIGNPRS